MGKGRFNAIGTRSDILRRLKRTMFTHTCVLLLLPLQLFVLSSAEELRCSVTRLWAGDRIHFVDYNGSCNTGVNPCQIIDGSEWKDTKIGCICQCKKSTTTYREDDRYCVANRLNREGCTLLFNNEKKSDNLRVFNNSSSIKLNSLPKDTCKVKATYYITNEATEGWKQLPDITPAFLIRHEDRRKTDRYAHFLKWNNDKPVSALEGKIVKVDIECAASKRRDDRKATRKLCIVFKVKGSISLPCLVGIPSTDQPTSDTSTAAVMMTVTTVTPNKTRPSNETTQKPLTADVVTGTIEPNTTPSPSQPSNNDSGDRKSYTSDKVALPIWLIAVIAGGAVIATLAITAIIWICCKMKQRSRRRRKKRTKCGNSVYNNDDDDTVITFATSGAGSGVDEAGYARVGSPPRKGYAFLKSGPERCKSEYQRLVKPGEDHSGYLVPMEERTPTLPPTPVMLENPSTTDAALYSEAASPPPQDKPKSKDYDYAKPEDFISLTASRSSLDKLDAHEAESGYVPAEELSESNDIVPSPFYATVMGPSSPGLPTEAASKDLPPEDTPSENDSASDTKNEYVELLPDTSLENGNSVMKELDSVA